MKMGTTSPTHGKRGLLALALFAVLAGPGCASLTGGAPWPIYAAAAYVGTAVVINSIDLNIPEEIPAELADRVADDCVRALVGTAMFDRGFVREGVRDARSYAYRYTYTFDLDPAGDSKGLIQAEVSLGGGARIVADLRGHPYFDYDDDLSVYRYPFGPCEALAIGMSAGLDDVAGPVRVYLAGDWIRGYLTWRVDRYVEAGRRSYYATVDIDPRSGIILNNYKNHIVFSYDDVFPDP